MYLKIKNSRLLKGISVFSALNLMFQIFYPTAAYALTSGPTQPEVQSFEPVGTNQMVDLFSGDFSYNIPLLTVPGPNGGYPINMAYHAGIGMEQEASWVGLGWNINPGVINRQLRGLPDDFDGAKVKKEYYTRPNKTSTLSIGGNIEALGIETDGSASIQLFTNNYTGVGIGFSVNPPMSSVSVGPLNGGLSLDYNSSTGVGLNTTTSLPILMRNASFNATKSFRYTSSGLESSSLTTSAKTGKGSGVGAQSSGTSSHSYGSSFFTPSSSFPTKTEASSFSLGTGPTALAVYGDASLGFSISTSELIGTEKTFDAYGYMYSENTDDYSLMDFSREKDAALPKAPTNLGVPVFTYDRYQVLGQGIAGVFRPHRSEAGYLHDPVIENESFTGLDISLEGGFGALWPGLEVSAQSSGFYHNSYTGPWRNMSDEPNSTDYFNSKYEFRAKKDIFLTTGFNNDGSLYEPFYMKSTAEKAAWEAASIRDKIATPYAFPLGADLVNERLRPRIHNPITMHLRERREKKEQAMFMKSFSDLEKSTSKDHYDILQHYSATSYEELMNSVDFEDASMESHIAEITAYNPDGMRYVYGLPAYNKLHKEVVFAVGDPNIGTSGDGDLDEGRNLFDYNPSAHVKAKNGKGQDSFFSRNTTPAYTHSHLLTSIYSADYVDLKGDGPTEDDLGYYVKFNYEKTPEEYKWRIPYYDADYLAGEYSNYVDNKASYTYGEKDLYFVSSIETKTHISHFILGDRNDGFGVSDEHQDNELLDEEIATGQKKLERIDLYSKRMDDYMSHPPLKSVHFEYDYSLCKGIYNDKEVEVLENSGGKLTLKKVYFTYGDSKKTALSPYQFSYSDFNPDYGLNQMDRWGFYKAGNKIDNRKFPYVDQRNGYNAQRDLDASAWNLTKIQLPSGAEMTIDYEQDSYTRVQNLDAMQAMKVLGMGGSNNINSDGYIRNHTNLATSTLIDDFTYVYFELNEMPSSPAEGLQMVNDHINGVNDVYFKMYMELKDHPIGSDKSGMAKDYVEGYAEVDHGAAPVYTTQEIPLEGGGSYTIPVGAFKLKTVKIGSLHPHGNPIQKAAIQKIKLQRNDLRVSPQTDETVLFGVEDLIEALNFFDDLTEFIMGYYTFAVDDLISGDSYGERISIEDDFPSVVRLKCSEEKYGGGHRVKRISINDKWGDMTDNDGSNFGYGQDFYYANGNAEYEPQIGNEENPFRKPIRQNPSDFINKNDALYTEKPYGEMFFPGANVGYGRVVVHNIVRDEEKDEVSDERLTIKSGAGVVVNDFYTSANAPVLVMNTTLAGTNYVKRQHLDTNFPFSGGKTFDTRAYSQGYSIFLNDMHGKQKAVTTYRDDVVVFDDRKFIIDSDSPFTSKVSYTYNTNFGDAEEPEQYLGSKVKILYPNGDKSYGHIGKTVDYYVDSREDFSVSETFGFEASFGGEMIPGVPFPFGWVMGGDGYHVTENLFRSVTSVKMHTLNATLTKVRTNVNGGETVLEHKIFDSETGRPVLSRVRNEFGRYIYQKNYPAHHEYDRMGGAYHNIGATYETETYTVSPGKLNFGYNPELSGEVFVLGDQIEVSYTDYPAYNFWVRKITEVASDLYVVELEDALGNTLLGSDETLELEVVRSGRRNMMTADAGSKSYLEGEFKLVNSLNATLGVFSATGPEILLGRLENCEGVPYANAYVSATTHKQLAFRTVTLDTGEECETAYMNFPSTHDFYAEENKYLQNYTFKKIDDIVYANLDLVDSEGDAYSELLKAKWVDHNDCFEICELVLNAGAIVYKDTDWALPYKEMENPYVDNGNSIHISDENINEYRYGKTGIWHPKRSHTYLTKRMQTSNEEGLFRSDIAVDGYFKEFTEYNWNTNEQADKNWTWVEESTRYSPYGFEIESRNALDIYSSALYGYDGAMPIASAQNTKYSELAFTSFEENIPIGDPYVAGHISINPGASSEAEISDEFAHSGKYSIKMKPLDGTGAAYGENALWIDMNPSSVEQKYFNPIADKEYIFSVWAKVPQTNTKDEESDELATIILTKNNTESGGASANTSYSSSPVIDGWRRLQFKFSVPDDTDNYAIRIGGKSSEYFYFDDFRIFPFDGQMKSYVYDADHLRLLAELDVNNYGTFYNYDDAGKLVQVKKETENGIQTIKTTRENSVKQ